MAIKIKFSDLGKKSESAYCRKLIKDGVDPSESLELYRERETPDLTIHNIGEYAKWVLYEGDGFYRKKYKPFTGVKGAKNGRTSDATEV